MSQPCRSVVRFSEGCATGNVSIPRLATRFKRLPAMGGVFVCEVGLLMYHRVIGFLPSVDRPCCLEPALDTNLFVS